MKIEKVNENQIRCTLTREDLAERQIKLSELAYGTEKAKMLFRDMMQQAAYEFGFEADDIPLMIEAIPLSADTIILVITKVEYPEELDTRFSRFSDPDPEDLYEDAMSGSVQNAAAAGADDILGLFRKIQEEHKKAAKEPEGDTQTAESSEKTAKEETPVNVLVDITKLFVFKNLDEVTRLAHILNGFYAGANDLYKSQTALLTHADRDALMAQEIELPDCFENRVVREQVCFYKALTAPARGLWLSWPKGQGQTLCAALEPIVDVLRPGAPELDLSDLAATAADGLDVLGGGWPLTETERASLTEALHAPGGAEPEGLALLRRMAGRSPRQVSDLEALETLLGRRLRISPSQLEKYYTCRYGYFLQYVLGLRPRKRAELSADQSGTLMHWVLQMALDPHPGPDNPCAGLQPFLDLDDEAMAVLAGLLVDEYAKRYLPEDTARFAYLLSRLKKSMTGLLCYLRDEQRQSSFKPVACELKIGPGEDAVRGQTYRLSDGRTVQLIGTVDRADEWIEDDGTRWVRVVDYKTGTKKLDLREVYCGLDCQMLLYLFSLTRDADGRFTGAEPAGVLYLLADPAPETTTRGKAARSMEYKLDGLVRDEQKVFDAMDAEETGRYLPFSFRNGVPSPYQKEKRADKAKLSRIQLHLDDLVTQMGEQLYGGCIAAEPLVTGRSPCRWCDYGFICCHEEGIGERALDAPAKPFEPEEKKEEDQ